MDLTKSYPRSVRERLAGVVMLARTTDKARAHNENALGEYHYDCPMDKKVFGFLGIDADEFARRAGELSDGELEQWVEQTFVARKSRDEIRRFNEVFLGHAPERGSEGEKYFVELRDRIDPTRTDIVTWPDLLDLDEHREVPRRAA